MVTEAQRPRRVHICGCSGSGKSTLGKTLAERLDVPYIELDALYHGPNWEECPKEEFIAKVAPIAEMDGWVIDGNYRHVIPHVRERADTILFLDYPYALVWWRLINRTIRRMVHHELLWHGNRENAFRTFLTRDSIIWWMMTTWHKRRRDAIVAETCPELAEKTVLRFRRPSQTERWLETNR